MQLNARYAKATPSAQLVLTNSLASTPEIPMEEFAGGTIYIPANSAITTLTFYGAPRTKSQQDPTTSALNPQPAVKYYSLFNGVTAVTMTVAGGTGALGQSGQAYNLPADITNCGAIKIVINAASAPVELSMKS